MLWHLNKMAMDYVRMNASVKGTPNMTSTSVSGSMTVLLPNSTLEPGYPRNISVKTARRWLHQLGFEIITPHKGIFIDGHEREDVVEYCKESVSAKDDRNYSTSHRQRQNEMRSNAFAAQTQTCLHPPHPSNGLGTVNAQSMEAKLLKGVTLQC